MSEPTVSVVVPLHEGGWSIERTLRSACAQTLSDFELVVVDDGSTDNGPELVRAFAERDSRIRMVSQENRGLANARNRGIAEAKAPLVAPLDSDDLWHPEYLRSMADALTEDPAAPFAYAYFCLIDAEDNIIAIPRWSEPPRHDFEGLLNLNSVGNGSAAVFRRSALRAVGGYDESLRERAAQGAEDWKLILQLAKTAVPALVPRHLVGYRRTPGMMSRSDPRAQWSAIEAVLNDIASLYPDTPDSKIRHARTMMIAWLMPAFIRKGDWRAVARYGFVGYLKNPFWFSNRLIRERHLDRVRLHWEQLVQALSPRRQQRVSFDDWARGHSTRDRGSADRG